MSRRAAQQQAEAPGQDSFLDVVANLVGIMIILIIVVGAATKKAMVAAGPVAAIPASDAQTNSSEDDLQSLRETAVSIRRSIDEMQANLQRELFEVAYRQSERQKLLERLSMAKHVIAERRGKLDEDEQAEFDAASKLNTYQAELDSLQREKAAVAAAMPSAGIIEHLPTPMAKTVFGKEVHFRLSGGRIVFVPWDALLDKLKSDAPQKAPRLRDNPTITETVGPIQGFWLKYTLKLTRNVVNARGGTATEQRVELDHCLMLPVSEDIGEPIAEALRPSSDFFSILKSLNPERTTITVWVYPDSFNEYRELKKALFPLGYLTAARPMPADQPMGGSPDGIRSSAQ